MQRKRSKQTFKSGKQTFKTGFIKDMYTLLNDHNKLFHRYPIQKIELLVRLLICIYLRQPYLIIENEKSIAKEPSMIHTAFFVHSVYDTLRDIDAKLKLCPDRQTAMLELDKESSDMCRFVLSRLLFHTDETLYGQPNYRFTHLYEKLYISICKKLELEIDNDFLKALDLCKVKGKYTYVSHVAK
jgi:hypothetical protein